MVDPANVTVALNALTADPIHAVPQSAINELRFRKHILVKQYKVSDRQGRTVRPPRDIKRFDAQWLLWVAPIESFDVPRLNAQVHSTKELMC